MGVWRCVCPGIFAVGCCRVCWWGSATGSRAVPGWVVVFGCFSLFAQLQWFANGRCSRD
jgi:hypothetical protein